MLNFNDLFLFKYIENDLGRTMTVAGEAVLYCYDDLCNEFHIRLPFRCCSVRGFASIINQFAAHQTDVWELDGIPMASDIPVNFQRRHASAPGAAAGVEDWSTSRCTCASASCVFAMCVCISSIVHCTNPRYLLLLRVFLLRLFPPQ